METRPRAVVPLENPQKASHCLPDEGCDGLVLPAACLEPPRGCEPLCVLGALTAPGEPLSLIADYAIYAGVPCARARRVSREVERILADLG